MDIEVDDRPVCPGGILDVRVSLFPQESFYVREGRIELVCTEGYYTFSRIIPPGDRFVRTHNSDAPNVARQLAQQSELFLNATEVYSGVPYRNDVKFLIPADALLTVNGRTAKIDWQLIASLDIIHARDIRQSKEVIVVSPPLDLAARNSAMPSSLKDARSTFEQCTVSLHLSSLHVRMGDTLEGILRVHMQQPLNLWGIRVDLECSQRAGERVTNTVEDQVVLQEAIGLSANEVQEWPFQLQVPAGLLPSTDFDETLVVWRVRGVLDRNIQTDFRVEQVILVYTVP